VEALLEMKKDLETKLQRYRTWVSDLRETLAKENSGTVYPTR
jgi:hypothetical protein